MTDSKVDIARRAIEAFNRQDVDRLFADVAPDVVFDWSRSIGPQRGIYRSAAEGRRWLGTFMEAWDEFTWNPEELLELDEEHLLVVNRVKGRGKGSGVEVNARGAQLWTIRRDQVAGVSVFQSKQDAIKTFRLERARLYFVCEGLPHGGDPAPLLDSALRGGADMIQLREKAPRSAEEVIARAAPFRRAADEHGALFVLNDESDLVDACRADGVHVGQDDAPVAEARRTAEAGALVGLSTHAREEIDAACSAEGESRPDYLSVGPVWETPTKEGRPAAGLGLVEYAAANAPIPWFAIGGIDPDNVSSVAAAGAERVVVVRAIRDAADPEAAARSLATALPQRAGSR